MYEYICKYIKINYKMQWYCPYREESKKEGFYKEHESIVSGGYCPNDVKKDKTGVPICYITR